jgi:hypothetical protein
MKRRHPTVHQSSKRRRIISTTATDFCSYGYDDVWRMIIAFAGSHLSYSFLVVNRYFHKIYISSTEYQAHHFIAYVHQQTTTIPQLVPCTNNTMSQLLSPIYSDKYIMNLKLLTSFGKEHVLLHLKFMKLYKFRIEDGLNSNYYQIYKLSLDCEYLIRVLQDINSPPDSTKVSSCLKSTCHYWNSATFNGICIKEIFNHELNRIINSFDTAVYGIAGNN